MCHTRRLIVTTGVAITDASNIQIKKSLPVRQGTEKTDHRCYLAVGVCIEMILLRASAHASATAAFGDVQPGGVANPLSLM
jgi:hypothetical protein